MPRGSGNRPIGAISRRFGRGTIDGSPNWGFYTAMRRGGTRVSEIFVFCWCVASGSLFGCGSSPKERSACAKPAQPLKTGLCALPSASAAHVEKVLGLADLTPPLSANETSGITACSFCGSGNVLLHFQAASDATAFAIYRRGLEIGNDSLSTDYPDFGDEAFTLPLAIDLDGGLGSNCLGVRQGSWGVLVCAADVELPKLHALAADLLGDLEKQ